MGSRFYCSDGHAELRGDLLVAESLEVLETNDRGLAGGQLVDGSADLPYGVGLVDIGRQGDDRRVVDGDVVEGARRPPRFAPVDVDGDALGDRRQPGRRVALHVETVGRLPGPHERQLRGLLGELRLTEG